jgi:hypothetical protein
MASIKQRKTKDGKTRYYVQVRLKGQDPQCASFERITDAKKWIQDMESDIRSGRHFKTAESKKHTLGDMIDRYVENVLPLKEKCLKRQGAQLLWWKEQLGNKLLADITPGLLGEFTDKLLKETTVRKKLRAPATVVRYLAALSHAFSICVDEWGWLDDSPIERGTFTGNFQNQNLDRREFLMLLESITPQKMRPKFSPKKE